MERVDQELGSEFVDGDRMKQITGGESAITMGNTQVMGLVPIHEILRSHDWAAMSTTWIK